MLLAGEEVSSQGSKDYALYGQEKTGATYNLARMNMFLHGQDSARIEWGDTLNNPLLKENDRLMQFDVIVANPPFSLDKWAKGFEPSNSDVIEDGKNGFLCKNQIFSVLSTIKLGSHHIYW